MPRKKSSDAEERSGAQSLRRAPRKRAHKGVSGEDRAVANKPVSRKRSKKKEDGKEEAKEAEVLAPLPTPASKPREISVGKFVAEALLDKDADTFISQSVAEAARKNDKRPAYISFHTPDDFVKNLVGYAELRDLYFFVRVKREFYEKATGG